MTTPLIEAIARAIITARVKARNQRNEGLLAAGHWPDNHFEPHHTDWAREFLTAITEAGYAVVPVEPTEALMDMGGEIFFEREFTPGIWERMLEKQGAMISAAQGDGT